MGGPRGLNPPQPHLPVREPGKHRETARSSRRQPTCVMVRKGISQPMRDEPERLRRQAGNHEDATRIRSMFALQDNMVFRAKEPHKVAQILKTVPHVIDGLPQRRMGTSSRRGTEVP